MYILKISNYSFTELK